MKKIAGTTLEIKIIINGIYKRVNTAQVSASNYAH